MGIMSVESFRGREHIQTAWTTKDNPIEVILREDCHEYDFSGAKSIRCKIGETLIDSEVDVDAFDRSEAEVGKLKIFIGDQNIKPLTYNVKIELTDSEDRVLYFGHVRVNIKDPGI